MVSTEQAQAEAWQIRLEEAFKDGWMWVTFDQYGPDGTTLTAQVVFWVCPLCKAMVSDDTEAPDDSLGRFRSGHYDWHLEAQR